MNPRCIAVLIVLILASAAADAQQQVSVLGTEVRLKLGSGRISGELLAVERDSLWLLPPDGPMRLVAFRDVKQVKVPRPGSRPGPILAWTLIGGLASGIALSAACSSVEGAECGEVLPLVAFGWLVVGGTSALRSAPGWRSLDPYPDALTPYARFPQGMPEAFRQKDDQR